MPSLYNLLNLTLFLIFGPLVGAQPVSVPLDGAKQVNISANYAAVEIRPGSGDAIEYSHRIVINGEAKPELSKIETGKKGETLYLREVRPTSKDFSERYRNITIDNNGQQSHQYGNTRIVVTLVVSVPPGVSIEVETLYGEVEAKTAMQFRKIYSTYGEIRLVADGSPLDLDSEYGSIDVSWPAGRGADVVLETQYGEILTDFNIDMDAAASVSRQFEQKIVGTIGNGGPRLACRSPYAKVYLRQQ